MKSTPGVMDTASTMSPCKGCEKTPKSRRACEYGLDEEHTGCDGYRENNEPMQGV